MIAVLAWLAWMGSGVGVWLWFWTKEFDVKTPDLILAPVAGLLGPLFLLVVALDRWMESAMVRRPRQHRVWLKRRR